MTIFRELQKGDQQKLEEIFRQPSSMFDYQEFNEEALMNDKNCNCIVIESDGKIAGFACLVIYRVPTKGLVGRIEDVIVDEKYRGQGLGRGVMLKLIEIARNNNLSLIDLTSNPQREIARKLYESIGFEIHNTGVFRLKLK